MTMFDTYIQYTYPRCNDGSDIMLAAVIELPKKKRKRKKRKMKKTVTEQQISIGYILRIDIEI